jgi:hypothetical protein
LSFKINNNTLFIFFFGFSKREIIKYQKKTINIFDMEASGNSNMIKFEGRYVTREQYHIFYRIYQIFTMNVMSDGSYQGISGVSIKFSKLPVNARNPSLNPPPGISKFYGEAQYRYEAGSSKAELNIIAVQGAMMMYEPNVPAQVHWCLDMGLDGSTWVCQQRILVSTSRCCMSVIVRMQQQKNIRINSLKWNSRPNMMSL